LTLCELRLSITTRRQLRAWAQDVFDIGEEDIGVGSFLDVIAALIPPRRIGRQNG